ncbi:MAG: caspase family protein, partial [Actinomycetota bacterium]|nr:caspase family protein [Actinomycetota bacterium]
MSGRRLALVVATDRYDDPTLHGLAAPAADAEALANVLGDPDLGGFEIEVLRNPTSWETAQQVEMLLSERVPGDLVLLHFSCHGLKDESGELFLAARNTSPTRLASTAVDTSLVNRLMQRSRAQRVVLLLDCCYGGAFERGVVARADPSVHVGDRFSQGRLVAGRGRVVITASSAMEYALEGTDLTVGGSPQPSLFTGALVNGLSSGEADRDQDGQVGLDELYDYVFERVRERSPNQTPSKWEFGLQGDLVIARNPRRQIRPGSVPEDIAELVHHPTAGVRLGAVDELARIAAQENLGRAAGAVLLLRRLLDDDSRRVSQAAAVALDKVAPTALPGHVDFDDIPVGATSAEDVHVQGGPLALASTVETSRTELQARFEGPVLQIEVTGTTVGPLEGWVSLTSPAGELRIPVTATVVAGKEPSGLDTIAAPPSESTPARPAEPMESTPPPRSSVPVNPRSPAGGTAHKQPPQIGHEDAAGDDTGEAASLDSKARTVGRRRWYALAAVLPAAALIAWLVLRDVGQPNNETPPQPFTSAALYDFANAHFDADECIVPNPSQAPVASTLPH